MATGAPRRLASAMPSIKGLVISPPGAKAALVDISASGLLADCGVSLKVGQSVTVSFDGTFTPRSVAAHVVRSSVAAMTSAGVRYHVGFAFQEPIALDETPPSEKSSDNGSASPVAPVAPVVPADPPSPPPVVNRW